MGTKITTYSPGEIYQVMYTTIEEPSLFITGSDFKNEIAYEEDLYTKGRLDAFKEIQDIINDTKNSYGPILNAYDRIIELLNDNLNID